MIGSICEGCGKVSEYLTAIRDIEGKEVLICSDCQEELNKQLILKRGLE